MGAVIGRLIYRYRWLVVVSWLLLAGAIALLSPPADPTPGESGDLLPPDTSVHAALDQLARHFGDKSALSDVVIVFERADGPLTSEDLAAIDQLGRALAMPLPAESIGPELGQVSIRTPASLPLDQRSNPLLSDDAHAALVTMSLPWNFISKQAARFVIHAQTIVGGAPLPPGLSATVTGSAGYGYDYAIATERSHRKTMLVTLCAVLVILLLIYRAPLVALLPLAGISVAALIVMGLLTFLDRFGLQNGMAERIFTFVLLYGAGIDYSLLFISRYREFLDEGRPSRESIELGLRASLAAIGSSTLMTASGLIMLCFAHFSVFRHSGPAVVLAVLVAAAAAMTLVPALLAIIGPLAFWPGRSRRSLSAQNPTTQRGPRRRARFWPALAGLVVRHPAPVLIVTLAAMLFPALRGTQVQWNYDALLSIKPTYPARRGTEIFEKHWAIGQIAPVTILAVSAHPQPLAAWQDISRHMVQQLRSQPDVQDVRALTAPLGLGRTDAQNLALNLLAGQKIRAQYLGADQQAMRLSVVLGRPALARAALDDINELRRAATAGLVNATFDAQIFVAGQTAEMRDLRDVTQRDFQRVAALALAAILLMVLVALRDLPLSIFIVAATLLSYLTTLGLTCWVFERLGGNGLEWKVQMLLFIVLMAVGQDYSIFFAVRLAQEGRRLPCTAATEKALIFTGPVISSCGLIMAATLGSVMAGDIQLLVQLGFAFALGMLIDTFAVRPLLLPAFIVLTRRTLRRAAAFVG